jgi:hypothetical protein
VGEAGRLFYEQTTGTGVAPVLKYSDGSTIGGLPISGSSLTFSSPTPPVNPHDGLLWWNNLDGRLYIYYDSVWVDASPESNSTTTGIDQSQYYVTTSTRTVSNGANKIVSLFGVGAAVSSSTRYMFNVAFDVTNGPNNDQLLFNITGTSVLSRVTVYSYSTIGGAHQLPIYTTVTSAFTTGINMNGGNNSNNGTEYTTIINGFIDVASAGTVNPSFGFVSVGSNVVVQPNAFMKIWPVSANTTTNSIIGTWS